MMTATTLTTVTRSCAHRTRRRDRRIHSRLYRVAAGRAVASRATMRASLDTFEVRMGSLGWPELLIIELVFILLFGAKKLPEAAKGLGQGIKNFKSAVKGETEDIKKETDEVKKEVEKV